MAADALESLPGSCCVTPVMTCFVLPALEANWMWQTKDSCDLNLIIKRYTKDFVPAPPANC